jgi:hypothetical protein
VRKLFWRKKKFSDSKPKCDSPFSKPYTASFSASTGAGFVVVVCLFLMKCLVCIWVLCGTTKPLFRP